MLGVKASVEVARGEPFSSALCWASFWLLTLVWKPVGLRRPSRGDDDSALEDSCFNKTERS